MQFAVLFSLNPEKAQTPPPQGLHQAEFEAVRGFYMDGTMRQIWLKSDGSGAIAIVEADSDSIVAERLSELPMVREGILQTPVVVPLSPYPGFAPRPK